MRRFRPGLAVLLGLIGALVAACAEDDRPAVTTPVVSADAAATPDAPTADAAPTPVDDAAAAPDAEAPGPTRLRLRVVDGKTGQPLPGMVSFFDAESGKMLNFGIIHRDDGTPSMGTTVR